jgi:hypothetical protein
MWQDYFNLNKKGMTLVDMLLLLLSLEAIQRIWTQEKSDAQSNEQGKEMKQETWY